MQTISFYLDICIFDLLFCLSQNLNTDVNNIIINLPTPTKCFTVFIIDEIKFSYFGITTQPPNLTPPPPSTQSKNLGGGLEEEDI